MKKSKNIALVTLLASSMLASSAALAQVKISGYTEADYRTGQTKGVLGRAYQPLGGLYDTATANTTLAGDGRNMGHETSVRFQTDHALPTFFGGLTATAMAELRRNVWEEREVRIGATDGTWLFFAGNDVPRGIEISRTINPTVNNRVTDIAGSSTGLIDVMDSSSSNQNFGLQFGKVIPGALSFSFMPNSVNALDTGTDTGGVTNAGESRFSVGYLVDFGGTRVGLGLLRGDNKSTNPAKGDSEAKTFGIRHTAGPISAGFQYHDNEAARITAATTSQEQKTASITYALNKEISVGYAKTRAENIIAGTTGTGKIDQDLIQAAYNFGPAVIQFDYAQIENPQYLIGTDMSILKAKVRVNF
jgi:hypothetical protein